MKQAILLCALAAPGIAAASEVGHWYVTPQVGGIWVDNDRPVKDREWLYGLSIGKHVSDALSVEMNLNGTRLRGEPGNADLSLYGGSIDLLGVMNRAGRVSPYITAGMGVARNERSPGSNASDFMTQAGLGMFMKLWENQSGTSTFALRPEVKARWDDAGADGHLVDYIGTLGFQFSFGAAPVKTAAVAPPPPPAPAPEPPPAPRDSDNDGVTDDLDRCPGTEAGVAVDAFGCVRKGSITLEGVTFELNSARLTGGSAGTLDSVATDLKKHPRLKIELQGHTDSSGSDQYNLKLSQQRADAVRTHLLEQGVPAGQLEARGYGEAQPIDNNATSEGRAHNRRVVMSVLDNPGEVKVQGEGSIER